jgi:hypothetical protein
MKMERQILCKMEEIMLELSEFRHNHHPSVVKILANFIQRGFPVNLNKTIEFLKKCGTFFLATINGD